jgi:hypothetical protein
MQHSPAFVTIYNSATNILKWWSAIQNIKKKLMTAVTALNETTYYLLNSFELLKISRTYKNI